MNVFEKKVEEFRHHYKVKYGVELDDVTLYFFIRVNEMQKDLKKEIKNIPRITFRSRWDYFFYGIGKNMLYIFIVGSIFALILILK